ncbi:hypothetical protein F2Q70_00035275 [Brassica cretica]|uniref:Uncharacterized protein n=1 Tax=Brassica cretica TaxID=69181 RepID=A0A8S9JRH8_BRACR|nr:hypothetical protein F2Q70_00035275 [Brassica cretica]
MGVNTGRGLGAGADTTNAPDVTKVCSSVSVRASRQARMLRRSTKLKQPIPLGWSPLYANQKKISYSLKESDDSDRTVWKRITLPEEEEFKSKWECIMDDISAARLFLQFLRYFSCSFVFL